MKNTKAAGFFINILLILMACQNPALITPSNQEEAPASPADVRPFSATIILRGGGAGPENSRAITGPLKQEIEGIFNFVQIIVMDETREIVDFVEGRRNGNGSYEEQFSIDIPSFGKYYYFLMLAGYLEENSKQPPTLLASGFATKKIDYPHALTMILWPLIIDTKFTRTMSSGKLLIDPESPPVSLPPVAWSVQWTVQNSDTGGNGFDELLRAQTNTGGDQLFKNKKPVVVGSATAGSLTVSGSIVTLDITDMTQGIPAIGRTGAINFNLEYVPFYQIIAAKWTKFNERSVFDLNGGQDALPVWIIRNGLNDLAQNAETDFSPGAGNGNGAISFVVEEDKGTKWVLKDGAIVSGNKIKFTTDGYGSDKADLYYAVVPKGIVPPRSDYKILGQYPTGIHDNVSVPGFGVGTEVYLILLKDGTVSDILVISADGSVTIDFKWGSAASSSE